MTKTKTDALLGTATRANSQEPTVHAHRRSRIGQIHAELVAVTSGCRPDMHEPDEQGLKARVVGDHLDNACSAHIDAQAIAEGFQEFVVCLQRFDGVRFHNARVNLADLIALARMARIEDGQ